jgi:hypothetical protein
MTMPPAVVAIDFLEDWKQILIGDLNAWGYPTNPSDDLFRVSIRFFNAKLRRITPVPRKVHEAKEFVCPPDRKTYYDALKAEFQTSSDVTHHLSTKLEIADYYDQMLNDWGIHHFHLGPGKHASVLGFSDRTSLLLYAYVTSTDVYCINILKHGKWSEEGLLRIIHCNWPQVIARYRLKEALRLIGPPKTSTERALLRKHGVSTAVEIEPGVIYYSPGGGYMSDGTPHLAVVSADTYFLRIRNLEALVRDNLPAYLAVIRQQGSTPATPPSFKLAIYQGMFVAVETGSNVAIPLEPV